MARTEDPLLGKDSKERDRDRREQALARVAIPMGEMAMLRQLTAVLPRQVTRDDVSAWHESGPLQRLSAR